MLLGDQLLELRRNILRDRSDLIAGDADSLWDDETLLRYIKDGERRFARATLLLRDGTTPQFCNFTLREGVRDYPLNELVIAVVSARVAGQMADLYHAGHALVQVPKRREVLDFDSISNEVVAPGTPRAIYTDETLVFGTRGRVTASIYPLPDTASDGLAVTARVVRLPKGDYTLDDLGRESEIPEDYQLDTLRWSAYRALSTFDGDAGAPGTAAEHKTAFNEAVVRAIRETKRKIFVGTGLNYGTLGFSYVR